MEEIRYFKDMQKVFMVRNIKKKQLSRTQETTESHDVENEILHG